MTLFVESSLLSFLVLLHSRLLGGVVEEEDFIGGVCFEDYDTLLQVVKQLLVAVALDLHPNEAEPELREKAMYDE